MLMKTVSLDDDDNQDVNVVFGCRGRQTTARGGCNVRQPKQNFVEIQKVCDFKQVNPKWPTWQVQKNKKEAEKAQWTHHPTRMWKRQAEKSPRKRRTQKILVLCHLNPKNAWED